MKIRAEITTGKIFEYSNELRTYYTCDIRINDKFKGDLYGDTREELQSLCDHIKTQTNGK